MLTIKFDTGLEQQYESSEMAEQAIQDVICNDQAKTAELLQDDVVVAEYSRSDFDC